MSRRALSRQMKISQASTAHAFASPPRSDGCCQLREGLRYFSALEAIVTPVSCRCTHKKTASLCRAHYASRMTRAHAPRSALELVFIPLSMLIEASVQCFERVNARLMARCRPPSESAIDLQGVEVYDRLPCPLFSVRLPTSMAEIPLGAITSRQMMPISMMI